MIYYHMYIADSDVIVCSAGCSQKKEKTAFELVLRRAWENFVIKALRSVPASEMWHCGCFGYTRCCIMTLSTL